MRLFAIGIRNAILGLGDTGGIANDIADNRLIGAFTPIEAIENFAIASAERTPGSGVRVGEGSITERSRNAIGIENSA